jgi:hypothetical protein
VTDRGPAFQYLFIRPKWGRVLEFVFFKRQVKTSPAEGALLIGPWSRRKDWKLLRLACLRGICHDPSQQAAANARACRCE